MCRHPWDIFHSNWEKSGIIHVVMSFTRRWHSQKGNHINLLLGQFFLIPIRGSQRRPSFSPEHALVADFILFWRQSNQLTLDLYHLSVKAFYCPTARTLLTSVFLEPNIKSEPLYTQYCFPARSNSICWSVANFQRHFQYCKKCKMTLRPQKSSKVCL